jgi:1-aminocyclopropane-1-carboxylate deaminase/D-cysteine desulfhydrase-like pyridoxal-dependent ACC family enzyme
LDYTETPLIELKSPFLEERRIRFLVKREDLNHPYVSGNKWWKLKYNLAEARQQEKEKIITFGGAFSNHIRATAAAASAMGLRSIGIIRGEEALPLNDNLAFAKAKGMELNFISRTDYRRKAEVEFLEDLERVHPDCYIIPEGGTNNPAVKGCIELGDLMSTIDFDFMVVPVGTGGTLAGLALGLPDRKLIGISVLKDGHFLNESVRELCASFQPQSLDNWQILMGYHFGGYAKKTDDLIAFIRSFTQEYSIPLEPVYSGKMMFAIFDLIRKGFFPEGSTVLSIHTGGIHL